MAPKPRPIQRIKLKDLTIVVEFLTPVRGDKDPAVVRITETTVDGMIQFDLYESEVALMRRVLEGWM